MKQTAKSLGSPEPAALGSLKIVAIYVVVGGLWIYVSDHILPFFTKDASRITAMASIKGLLFIVVTAALLYILISRFTDRLKDVNMQVMRLMEHSPVGIVVNGKDGKQEYFNKRFTEITGYTLRDIPTLDAWFLQAYPSPVDRAMARDRWSRRAENVHAPTGDIQVFEYESRIRTKSGEDRDVKISSTELDGPVIACFQDVTDPNRTQAALISSEEKYRTIFNFAPIGIFQISPQGALLTVNDAAAKMHGYPSASAMLSAVSNFDEQSNAGPYDRTSVIEQAVNSNKTITYEQEYGSSDDRALFARVSLRAIRSPDGSVQFIEGFSEDITDQKRADEVVAESEAQKLAFFRDVLSSVTAGRLRLCNDGAELPERLPDVAEPMPVALGTMSEIRRQVSEIAAAMGFDQDRISDLQTGIGEAIMNAVVHADGGVARIGADRERGVIQVWVEDSGGGIAKDLLHRATLERGYTTAGSFGYGFWMMYSTVDCVHLMTGVNGTIVVLEQNRVASSKSDMPAGLS